VVVQLKDALNTVWEVGETPGYGIGHFLRSYVVSLAAVLALGFLLMVSLLVTAGMQPLGNTPLRTCRSGFCKQWQFCLLLASPRCFLRWCPDTAIDWYDVWFGAAVTAVLFELGKSAIGFYIGKQGLESTYGAAASIIVVLIWVYYSSQIILMGAELTHAFAKHQGSIKIREQAGQREVK
jgi:membrane protein